MTRKSSFSGASGVARRRWGHVPALEHLFICLRGLL
jgi:hypothetical protein